MAEPAALGEMTSINEIQRIAVRMAHRSTDFKPKGKYDLKGGKILAYGFYDLYTFFLFENDPNQPRTAFSLFWVQTSKINHVRPIGATVSLKYDVCKILDLFGVEICIIYSFKDPYA